jgi:hypothetical protein
MKPASQSFFLGIGLTASVLSLACGGDVHETSGAGGGSGGTGSATASAGVGSAGAGGAGVGGAGGAATGVGGSGGVAICGGLAALPCALNEYCEYDDSAACGGDDSTGLCLPRPDGCTPDCPGVCGCDGESYCNECTAHAAGVDVDPKASCGPVKSCEQLADEIAAQAGGVHTCTSVVRLDYQTLSMKAYRILCAPYSATNEAAARATAQQDTGYGAMGALLSSPPSPPEDEWVFWQAPGDFGGVGVVNARNGTSVFGGSVVWDGKGAITYPATFNPPEALGEGCVTSIMKPPARGFDLVGVEALTQAEVDAALDVVWKTALPEGLWKPGYVFDAMVLLYPPTVGDFDESVAEWIVLVNSGWLE